MEIVSIKNNQAFTDSRIIAVGTNNKHHSITAVIQKYLTDFEDFGKVRFEMEPLASGQKEKVYILNQQQATLLMTYLRNSEITRKFKKELVRQFVEMLEELKGVMANGRHNDYQATYEFILSTMRDMMNKSRNK